MHCEGHMQMERNHLKLNPKAYSENNAFSLLTVTRLKSELYARAECLN